MISVVGIIDIGSNTVRLLVAAREPDGIRAVREERALLALGDEIERSGRIPELELARTAERARVYARLARGLGCRSVEVVVTAPGRLSRNAETLVRVLERAAAAPVRVLSAEEEGWLAYDGALAQAPAGLAGPIAVCDVGGGSTEIVIGPRGAQTAACESLDIGSLTLTRRFLQDDPPGKTAARSARAEVARHFEGRELAPVASALATGGSARSLRRLTGARRLGRAELDASIRAVSRQPSAQLAREHGLDPVRARTLLAGALVLAEVQSRLDVPLEVARGGLREGAALALLAETAAA